MNLLFLVEGEKTEPKIYEAWIKHLFPQLQFVVRAEDMPENSCRIIAGHGYPNMVSSSKLYGTPFRLEACLLDIKAYNNIDRFFICVDSEEESYQDRFNEVERKLNELKNQHGIDDLSVKCHIIIQHCCIETWALGNSEIPNQYQPVKDSEKLETFQAYYDIFQNDPEKMMCCPSEYLYPTKARFHASYLKEYLGKFGLSYTKRNPKCVQEKKYLDALRKRCTETNHLSSLKLLLDIWDTMLV